MARETWVSVDANVMGMMRAHGPREGAHVAVLTPNRDGRPVPNRDGRESGGRSLWSTRDGLVASVRDDPLDDPPHVSSGDFDPISLSFLGGSGAWCRVGGRVCVRTVEPVVAVGVDGGVPRARRRDWGSRAGGTYPPYVVSSAPARIAREAFGGTDVVDVDAVLDDLPTDDGLRDDGLDWSAYSLSLTVRHCLEIVRRVPAGNFPDAAMEAYASLRDVARRHRVVAEPWAWCRRSMGEVAFAETTDAVRGLVEASLSTTVPAPSGFRAALVEDALSVAGRVRAALSTPAPGDGALAPCR